MSTPGSAIWNRQHYGPGWPNCAAQGGLLTTVKIFGRPMAVNKRCKRAFRRIDRVFKDKVPKYYADISKEKDTGVFNCRPIAGTNVPSNHSFASCIDIDWQENARDGDRKSEMRDRGMPAIRKLEGEGLVSWGGDWGSPDDMHLDIIMTPEQIKRKYTWRGKLKKRRRRGKR